ncbi:putative bifunctional diguanylate cyclase/phosphodiesterase [Cytobacillus sp. FJAT-54145]|uniref:Bifunctional diguanylate cyclase/phosphodiesterase n=1 Tax=Cytobacillus spartinae TaxID=3299023 RepID=A0ABW6K8V3_9BACI
MLGLKNLSLRLGSEIFLLSTLIGLVLVSSSFKLDLAYGITFTFTSVFILLILRLFGIPFAILSVILTFLFIPHNFFSIASGGIYLLEVMFVGAFFYKGRKAKMFYVDALFWITIGLALVFLLNQQTLTGEALYFHICKEFINALFNVLVADMLLAYFPFYKLHKSLNKNSLSIHQFLSHITLISVLIPFFLSVSTHTWNTHKVIAEDITRQSENLINRFEREWRRDNQASQEINTLNEFVQRNETEEYNIIITDLDDHVLARSLSSVGETNSYTPHTYHIEEVTNHLFQALPREPYNLSIHKWAEGHYIYARTIDQLPIKMTIQFPISQFQEHIYHDFLVQLSFSIFFAMGIMLLVGIVSRIFMNNIKRLTIATTGLPKRLVKLENIEWPESYVADLKVLTQNMVKMADKLKELFEESIDMNKKLSEQTEQLKKSEDQLHQLAFYDVLTRLPNRLHFQSYVRNIITKNATKHIAIIFIDLNQFKQINDTLGHDAGDSLLQLTAEKLSRLNECHREVFRLGGDEFVIVHSVEDKKEILKTIDRIMKEFSRAIIIQEQRLYITASVGVSVYPDDGEDLDTLVKCADIAMYISKEKGGNVAQFFDESMRNQFQEGLIIENFLRKVVEKGGFELFYQPKFQLGKVSSVEALIRWDDPELGFVSPSTFIPVAEDIGLILRIDEWSLLHACIQNKKWQEEGLFTVPISVNLSAKHFQRDYLVPLIKRALDESGLEPQYLKLEITESVFIKDPDHVACIIHQLRDLGVRISIDDFGKGFSSLHHILYLPIDEIKIDRQFIQAIDQDEKKALLVKSIIELAHGLHLNVVAEGIEEEAERDVLEKMGCDELQGYLFSRPLKKDQMVEFLLSKDRMKI